MTPAAVIIGLASLGTAAALLIWPDSFGDGNVERLEQLERRAEEAKEWLAMMQKERMG